MKTFILLTAGLGIMVGCSPVSFDVDKKAICGDLGEESCDPGVDVTSFNGSYVVPTPKVDVLIVNDNSGTMQFEQRAMANRFNDFIVGPLNGLGWRLGITTMDISNNNRSQNGELTISPPSGVTINPELQDGKLLRFSNGQNFISETDVGVNTMFGDAIEIEQTGMSDERGILTAGMALSRPGFLRSDSTHVAVIMLTDEDVRSVGETIEQDDCPRCNNSQLQNMQAALAGFGVTSRDKKAELERVWNQVNQQRSGFTQKTISVHSLIVKPNDTSCLNSQNTQSQPSGVIFNDARYGRMYEDLSNDPKFKGLVGNICAMNYSSELSTIGNYIRGRTVRDIPLIRTCNIITDDPENNPITISINDGPSFVLGRDSLPAGITNIQAFPGRLEFTPNLPAGTKVSTSFSCNN